MKNLAGGLLPLLISSIFLTSACGSDSSDSTLTDVLDIQEDGATLDNSTGEIFEDLLEDFAEAEDPDGNLEETIEDTDVEAEVDTTPSFAAVYEEMNHASAVTDLPFLEDQAEFIRSFGDLPLDLATHIAITQAGIWIGADTGLFFAGAPFSGDFAAVADLPADSVDALSQIGPGVGGVLVAIDGTLYQVTTDPVLSVETVMDLDGTPLALFVFGDKPTALTHSSLCRDASCEPLPFAAEAQALSATCTSDAIYIGTDAGVVSLKGETWDDVWTAPGEEPVASLVPAPGGGLLVGLLSSLVHLDNDGNEVEKWSAQERTIPTVVQRILTVSDDGSRFAIGHNTSVSTRYLASDSWEHYAGGRWLQGTGVRSLDFAPDGSLWVLTDAGLSHLMKVQTTLAEKAEYYFGRITDFRRLGGFITPEGTGDDIWNPTSFFLNDDDNDGQWTQEAIGGLCYAYAVTGDERYYEAARASIENMMLLIDIPAAQFEEAGLGRGFISRSVVRDDEGVIFDNKATQSNWHLVEYEGRQYYWKDDTSSDETTGHFYGFPIYYDLCAKDDAERLEVGQYVVDLAGYIFDHGYQLIDLDGGPTEHGYWQPERLAIAVDGMEACMAAGHDIADCADVAFGGGFLNSAEILGAMVAAWHVSGEERFLDAYESLVSDHRYDELATFDEYQMTWTQPGIANYCDHELGDLAFLTLLRYDPNADRRALWLQSILDANEYELGERNPLKSLAIASAGKEIPGLEAGVRTLQEFPHDLRLWRTDNSHRTDYEQGPNDRHGDPQFTKAPPYDETLVKRWDQNPYAIITGSDPSRQMTTSFWLLPYWGLRYYNAIIDAP